MNNESQFMQQFLHDQCLRSFLHSCDIPLFAFFSSSRYFHMQSKKQNFLRMFLNTKNISVSNVRKGQFYTCSCQCILIQVRVTFSSKMSLHCYFKPGFPEPKGSLTHSIPSAAIAAANRKLQEMIADSANVQSRKQKPYRS